MPRIWVNKARSFEEAEKFDENYYLAMSEVERLETVQYLREMYYKMKGNLKDEGRERLRRIIKIIQ